MKKFYFSLAIAFCFCSARLFSQCGFNSNPTNGCAPLTVTFTPTGSCPSAYELRWHFGDNSPVLIDTLPPYVTHIYTYASWFNPWVEAYDNTGNYLGFSYGSSINVNGVGFNAPDSICLGDQVQFCPSGSMNSTNWDFGDATTSTQYCENHGYSSPGTYTITLSGNSQQCGNGSYSKAIVAANNVSMNLNAWTNAQNNSACPNQPVGFNTNGNYLSYNWDFGDGATSTQAQPQHTYTAVGTYTVSCMATNHCNKSGTSTFTMNVSTTYIFPNYIQLQPQPQVICPNSQVNFNINGANGYPSYEWNFGDASPLQTTTQNYTNHTYNAAVGTYTASCRITSYCGNDSTIFATVTISTTAPFGNQINIGNNSPICPNGIGGFQAPGGYISYEWDFGDGSPLETTTNNNNNHTYGSTITTYTVACTITNGCGNDTTIYSQMQVMNGVGFPSGNWFSLNVNNPYCVGDKASLQAPNGYTSYQWDFGDGNTAFTSKESATHSYTAIGTYTVSVLITNACGNTTTLYATAVVDNAGSFPNWLNIKTTPSSGSCPNDIVNFSLDNNSQYASYLWKFGDGDTALTVGSDIQHTYTATGTYSVSLTITNGCGTSTTLYTTVAVTTSSPISSALSLQGIQNPACAGDVITFIPKYGGSSYTYYWDFGDGGKDTTLGAGTKHTYASIGNYTATATAKNGCGITKTVAMTETISTTASPVLISSGNNSTFGVPGGEHGGTSGCAGDVIIFYFMGEEPNNLWNFGDGNTGTAVDHMLVFGGDGNTYPVTIIKHAYATNGTYTVSLTLTNKCNKSTTGSFVINIGGNLLVSGDMTTSPPPFTTCSPIDFIAFGGKNYTWDFGDGSNQLSTTSPTVSHSFAQLGVYVVSVVVTNGCGNSATYTKSINVTGASGPAVTLNSSSTPTCNGGMDGMADVSVSGGQAPYNYLWDNGQTTSAANGLSAGLYNVVVTDNIGCSSTFAVNISNPASIALAVSSTNAGCGLQTGTASVSVSSGGTPPFSYMWASGQTSSTATGLGWGSYSVTVTDNNGCTSSTIASVSEASGASVSVSTLTNVTCYGGSNGAIAINATGGNPPFTYAWSNGATTQNISALAAGSYSVMVIDMNGCKGTLNTVVNQAPDVVATTSVIAQPNCGSANGSVTVIPSGGNGGPYSYLWTNAGNKTTQTITGLFAKTYTVIVTDAAGCTKKGTAVLNNANAPSSSPVVTPVSCNNMCDGQIALNITGGTSPYSYAWSFATTDEDQVSNLCNGTYLCTVLDAAGCQITRIFTLNNPAILSSTLSSSAATCSSNGTATASISGGTTPYTYSWSNGATTANITGLAGGNY
ncbi:MAG: PKD domain-containing protein, partial [Bacteroidetes bacterium]|nr:PKD domain-containing protein [Bacteroidota bacterium]